MNNHRTTNDLWHVILDTVSEGLVLVDEDGDICHINSYGARALGISSIAARGKHFREVFCPSLPAEKCWVNVALTEGKEVRQHRFERELPDGKKQRLVANLSPLSARNNRDSRALISIQTENGTRQSHAQQEKQDAILGSLAEGLFTVDNEWRITSFNRAAQKITGWHENEVLGKFCKDVFASDVCIEGCPLAETLKRGKPLLDCQVEYHDKVGAKLPVKMNTAILYNSDSEAMGGVVSFRDCSIQKQVVEEQSIRTGFEGIIGKNRRMLSIYEVIRECAGSKATVLILGESGTGKELVANAIQKLSPRRSKPYVKVNCAAIPDTLLESELFGHVKGAFTDARAERLGRFELADGGTIFLDEVGDLTAPAQLRLLRILEQGEFQKLGSSETTRVDVRVIAATNRDLWQMVQEGSFRDDLYYRLNVIPMILPPLRQRIDDLPYLIEHFMDKYRRITKKPITEIADKAYDLLMSYSYPGNVRELENVIEHAFVRTSGNVITDTKLPIYVRQSTPLAETGRVIEDETDESQRIRHVLMQCHWNRQKAARRLGISRTTLWRRMQELDLLEEDVIM